MKGFLDISMGDAAAYATALAAYERTQAFVDAVGPQVRG